MDKATKRILLRIQKKNRALVLHPSAIQAIANANGTARRSRSQSPSSPVSKHSRQPC